MSKQDENWLQEEKRVNEVVAYIERKLERLRQYMKTLKERVIDIRKDFWDDVTVNLTELDDAIETQASLKQQAEFLSERERSHGQLGQQLHKLEQLKQTPYFGRIDFIEEGHSEAEAIYIGTSSLMDQHDENFLVYDWRAPISSMYYDYPPGPASYQAIDKQVKGEITLKRQYVIKQGKLSGMFDTGLTIGDHLLQSVLGQSADTTMKSIVATIQREQNKIIRNEKDKILVVQGVAGSGKTSAALQRVAYLLYRYREQLSADQMILFSPNPLFNSYVSRVLPELGEDNIKQMTFYNYIEQQLGKCFKIESPFDQMEFVLSENSHDHDQMARLTSIRYKASGYFHRQIDQFLEQLKKANMQFRNIRFRGELLFDKRTLADYFYQFPESIPIQNRLERLATWILKQLKEMEQTLIDADWVQDEVELLDKDDYLEAYRHVESHSPSEIETYDDHDQEVYYLKLKVIKHTLRPLRDKIKRFHFVDTKQTYLALFDQSKPTEGLSELEWNALAAFTKKNFAEKILTWEDATPFLYFERMLIGFDENRSIKHIFLDEAQDYSIFQIQYLARIYPNSRMTLLGDLNQAIYYHAVKDSNVLQDQISHSQTRITLYRSYRSTRPIVEFTRSFMPNGEDIEPFNRDGQLPSVIEVDNEAIAKYKLHSCLDDYLAQQHQNIAVITKTIDEAKQLARLLEKNDQNVYLINKETHTFKAGINVIPVYLAKGIEFDAVVVYNASAHQYLNELERNLLYTACTRAMHVLTLIAIGGVSHFIKEVPTDYYRFLKVHQINHPDE